jgi:glycosyltransferase involved in cell wall biosynthesis
MRQGAEGVKISIVTPTLNAMEYLPHCIASVQKQESDRGSIEHVIVDGGSTDGTVEFAHANGLMVLVGKDRGIFDAINKGSFNSSGELIGFLGADDLLLEGALDAVLRSCEQHPNAAWLSGGVKLVDGKSGDLGDIPAPPSWFTASMHACLGWCCLSHMATYISRPFFTELGGFDIDYHVAGDYEMFCRARVREAYVRINRTIACERVTGANYSVVNGRTAWQQSQRVQERFGPSSQSRRRLNRLLMRAWVYGFNPGWVVRKRIAERRFPFSILPSRAST